MKRSRLIISVIIILLIIAAAAVFVNWKIVDFCTPAAAWVKATLESKLGIEAGKVSDTEKPDDEKGSAESKEPQATVDTNEPAKTGEPEKSVDVNEPNEPEEPNEPIEPNEPVEPNEPEDLGDPNNPLEALNLKDVEMKDIIQKLAEWTGKVIIPTDEAMKQKITIYSSEKLPRSQALSHIYAALRAKGFVAEVSDDAIYLKSLKDAKFGSVPTISANQPLAGIENKNRVVQRFFKLRSYSPTQMRDIVLPLIGEYGYVSADENTGNLLIIDTVENLIRFERIIAQFDVPESEQTVEEIFEIRYGDPAEIVQLLRKLLSGGRAVRASAGKPKPAAKKKPAPGKPEKAKAGAVSVVIESVQTPIVLIPEPRRKWIIARASAEDMKQIAEWIEKLDTKEPLESESETIPITYVDVTEVANRLNQALREMPGTELKASVLVQPLTQARQIMIFGRAEMREMVKKLIEEIDVPSGQFETEVFELKYADPEQIKKNIDELYGETDQSSRFGYYYYRGRRGRSPADTVKVIAFPTMQQVTVIASPENMEKIREQIVEWDVPIDVDKVKPRIIPLQNSDPVKMAELLTTLFSEEAPGRRSIWDYYFGRGEEKKKIVGPLYGQLTFEAVPDTKKIIVISNIPEAYTVVEQLVEELDRQEMAEVPKVITLNYADPEELAERLNAIFNEPGTIATIRLGERGLSTTGMEEEDQENKGTKTKDSTAQTEYKPWWTGRVRRTDEMPISNVIGRIRFIPDPRSKAILVLAPPEFMGKIEDMIKELDRPGKQVRIKAIVVEVDHSDVTSLGLQLASNPLAFGTLEENAITVLDQLINLETHGSLTLDTSINVTSLVDLLVRKTNAKVLNQQTLWTKDNEEADFFKGQTVAFIKGIQTSVEAGSITQQFDFERVGMTLRARPNITPKKKVDMNIDLTISQLTSELINSQPVRTYMNTTTTAIVETGQTIMLGGILFQKDSEVERKIALLGDIPLVGGLFRHNETIESNNELIIFITPEVIDDDDMLAETKEAEEKLENMLRQLNAAIDSNEYIEDNQ